MFIACISQTLSCHGTLIVSKSSDLLTHRPTPPPKFIPSPFLVMISSLWCPFMEYSVVGFQPHVSWSARMGAPVVSASNLIASNLLFIDCTLSDITLNCFLSLQFDPTYVEGTRLLGMIRSSSSSWSSIPDPSLSQSRQVRPI